MPENDDVIRSTILEFLNENKTTIEQVDLILTSYPTLDSIYQGKPFFPFKSLCGDYPTASGFAMWMAAIIIKEQITPFWIEESKPPYRNILIHNCSDDTHHSLILISKS